MPDPLDAEGILWVAAIDRVPIEERIEWVAMLLARVEQINAARAAVPEPPPTVEWSDVQPGDTISLIVFGLQTGHERERRTVVAVDWPLITLAEGDREYEIDASAPDKINRCIRVEERPVGLAESS